MMSANFRQVLGLFVAVPLCAFGVGCSLLTEAKTVGDGPNPPNRALAAATREVEAAEDLGRILHSSAENRRMLTDAVARQFPEGGRNERDTVEKDWAEASRLYGESIRRVSKINAEAVRSVIETRKAAAAPGEAKKLRSEILELVSLHQSKMRGRLSLTAAEWEQDYRTLHFLRPASEDPASKRGGRILSVE